MLFSMNYFVYHVAPLTRVSTKGIHINVGHLMTSRVRFVLKKNIYIYIYTPGP